MKSYLACFSIFVLSACSNSNKNPDILLTEPYRNVSYIAEPGPSYQAINSIQVTTGGINANILNTIPQLYKKALDLSASGSQVLLSNISITTFTKREMFQVPHQDCKSVPRTTSVPQTTCYSGSCTTTYRTQTNYVQQCTTRYTSEMRDVLYQKATADILTNTDIN